MKKALYPFLFIILLVVASCGKNPLDVDASEVQLDLKYLNLDSIIQQTPMAELQSKLISLQGNYKNILDYELYYCLEVGGLMDTTFEANFINYSSNQYIERLDRAVQKKFPSLFTTHQTILNGFKHLKYHLPKETMPKTIVYMNSKFASSAFCTENEIAIGLERYLGAKNEVIKELPEDRFYQWVKKAMEPEYMERDAVAAWIMTHICPLKEGSNNIEAIINWGKIMYLTEAAFPEMDKRLIVRYSEKDYNWAMENERSFWDFIVKQKMLFSKDEQQQANLLQEAPFTAGLPEKGPDRLGQFLGWRIIQSYMEQNDVTLQELIKLPYTELLQEYEIND